MFNFIRNIFGKKEEKKMVVNNSILGDDFDIKVKEMLDQVLGESRERINKDLQEILPGIKL